MPFMKGVEPAEAGWFTRFIFWITKRKFGELAGKSVVAEPVKIAAHDMRILKAMGQMEGAQAATNTVPINLKLLASRYAGMLVGCPF